jgi:hypothetical protein
MAGGAETPNIAAPLTINELGPMAGYAKQFTDLNVIGDGSELFELEGDLFEIENDLNQLAQLRSA